MALTIHLSKNANWDLHLRAAIGSPFFMHLLKWRRTMEVSNQSVEAQATLLDQAALLVVPLQA